MIRIHTSPGLVYVDPWKTKNSGQLRLVSGLQQMHRGGVMECDVMLRKELLRLPLTSTLLRLSMWQTGAEGAHAAQPMRRASFRRFCNLLERDFAAQHRVQHYASQLGMREKTLSRVCAAAAGVPAKALINHRLLVHTSSPVGTIAHEVGFDEASNFVKFFRKETGMTPLAFRRHILHQKSP